MSACAGGKAHSLDTLGGRLKQLKPKLSDQTYVRVYRSLSWLEAALDRSENEEDLRFIALWISFNSLYGGIDFIPGTKKDDNRITDGERGEFRRFVGDLVDRDKNRLWKALATTYEQFIGHLIDNKYVYFGFWRDHYQEESDERKYDRHFRHESAKARQAFARQEVGTMLTLLFNRIYVLRNQLMHGASTHQGSLNRGQVRAANDVLNALLPAMLHIMLDILDGNPGYARWARLPYPPVGRPDPEAE